MKIPKVHQYTPLSQVSKSVTLSPFFLTKLSVSHGPAPRLLFLPKDSPVVTNIFQLSRPRNRIPTNPVLQRPQHSHGVATFDSTAASSPAAVVASPSSPTSVCSALPPRRAHPCAATQTPPQLCACPVTAPINVPIISTPLHGGTPQPSQNRSPRRLVAAVHVHKLRCPSPSHGVYLPACSSSADATRTLNAPQTGTLSRRRHHIIQPTQQPAPNRLQCLHCRPRHSVPHIPRITRTLVVHQRRHERVRRRRQHNLPQASHTLSAVSTMISLTH